MGLWVEIEHESFCAVEECLFDFMGNGLTKK